MASIDHYKVVGNHDTTKVNHTIDEGHGCQALCQTRKLDDIVLNQQLLHQNHTQQQKQLQQQQPQQPKDATATTITMCTEYTTINQSRWK
jgi:hypothetical protein